MSEKDFDDITAIASQICDTPIALISLVDEKRQWFKSKVGLTAEETPREFAFCAHAILQNDVFIISDSSKDERFFDNPLATGAPHVRFYAGAPLLSPDGYPIGTVCVIDSKPRTLTAAQISAMSALSNQVTRLLELKVQIKNANTTHQNMVIKETALDNITEGVVLQSSDGKIIEFNPSASLILGLTADQMSDKSSMDPDWHAIREDGLDFPGEQHPAMVALKTGKKQENIIMGIQTKTNKIRWIRITSIPLFLNKAKLPTHAVTSFSDITEQLLSQKKIMQNQKSVRFILDGLPFMVGYWNADLINIDANSTYSTYFGKTPDEIYNKHIEFILGPELYKKNLPYLTAVLSGNLINFERDLTTPEGQVRNTLATYIPNFENGKVVSFLTVVTDITEIKKLELDRRNLELQLTESSRLSSLGEMASGIAHEINNPLAIILGKSISLRKKIDAGLYDKELIQKDFTIIENTVDRIAKIIKGLLTYSRNAEKDPFEIASLSSIIENTLSLCEERLRLNSVQLRSNCASDIFIECRTAQISQLLMNLIINAFDAVNNLTDKWIDISVSVVTNKVKLTISDSGSGITADIVNKIMQPFFTTKEVGKGTGLGLSISKGIAETHNGTLEYDPKEKNTTFILILPIAKLTSKKKSA
ncbi:MAG: ATP-binding protein [Pseudobdellovibrio sp.]